MSQSQELPLIHGLTYIPASAVAATRNNPRLTIMLVPNDPDTVANDWEVPIRMARQAWEARRHADPDLCGVILGTLLFYQDCVRILVETRPQEEPGFYKYYDQYEFYTASGTVQLFDDAVRLASQSILEENEDRLTYIEDLV